MPHGLFPSVSQTQPMTLFMCFCPRPPSSAPLQYLSNHWLILHWFLNYWWFLLTLRHLCSPHFKISTLPSLLLFAQWKKIIPPPVDLFSLFKFINSSTSSFAQIRRIICIPLQFALIYIFIAVTRLWVSSFTVQPYRPLPPLRSLP